MRRLVAASTACLALLLLTACAAQPVVTPAPRPSYAEFFASEDDALEATTAFLQQYVDALTVFVATNGSDPTLATLVSAEQLEDEQEALNQLEGRTLNGQYGVFAVNVQQYNQDSAEQAYVQAYMCMDYRQTYFTLPDGTRQERGADWAPFEAIMYSDADRHFVVQEMRQWTGGDFCAPGP